ncbi:MAG: hypothetical protein O7E52_14105 [Candidatus Poribacteria bacterium]|nr:hypothetical protein [Candidatus Poribacteria bacterium]
MAALTVGHPRYATEEIAARAKALYEQEIRAKVEPNNKGKYIVIDIETGEYEIDENHFAGSRRAAEKHPGGARFAMRIGYQAMGRIGAKFVEEKE